VENQHRPNPGWASGGTWEGSVIQEVGLWSERSEPSEEAVRNRLNKQRDHLFTFLDHDGVDATNNLAERQLRPAVIARKISCGNKTQKGARTWQILASPAATCAQRATSFIAELARAAPLQPR
jgi:transposase